MAARLYLLHDKSNQGGLRPRGWGAAEITPSTLLCSLRLLSVPCLFCTSVNLARLLQPPQTVGHNTRCWKLKQQPLPPIFPDRLYITERLSQCHLLGRSAINPSNRPKISVGVGLVACGQIRRNNGRFFCSKSCAHGGRFRLTSHHPEWDQESTRVDKTLKSLMCSIQRAKRETMVEIYSSWSW